MSLPLEPFPNSLKKKIKDKIGQESCKVKMSSFLFSSFSPFDMWWWDCTHDVQFMTDQFCEGDGYVPALTFFFSSLIYNSHSLFSFILYCFELSYLHNFCFYDYSIS